MITLILQTVGLAVLGTVVYAVGHFLVWLLTPPARPKVRFRIIERGKEWRSKDAKD